MKTNEVPTASADGPPVRSMGVTGLSDEAMTQVAGGAADVHDRTELGNEICGLIGECTEARKVSGEKRLVGDLGLDSLDLVDLYRQLEDRYDVRFPQSMFGGDRSVGDLIDMIDRLLE